MLKFPVSECYAAKRKTISVASPLDLRPGIVIDIMSNTALIEWKASYKLSQRNKLAVVNKHRTKFISFAKIEKIYTYGRYQRAIISLDLDENNERFFKKGSLVYLKKDLLLNRSLFAFRSEIKAKKLASNIPANTRAETKERKDRLDYYENDKIYLETFSENRNENSEISNSSSQTMGISFGYNLGINRLLSSQVLGKYRSNLENTDYLELATYLKYKLPKTSSTNLAIGGTVEQVNIRSNYVRKDFFLSVGLDLQFSNWGKLKLSNNSLFLSTFDRLEEKNDINAQISIELPPFSKLNPEVLIGVGASTYKLKGSSQTSYPTALLGLRAYVL